MTWRGLIAEYKPRSPYGWEGPNVSIEDFIAAYPDAGGCARASAGCPWGGSWELVGRAQRVTDKPVLAKGVLGQGDLDRARRAGCHALVIAERVPWARGEHLVWEATSFMGCAVALMGGARAVAINARDLATDYLDVERHAKMRHAIPDGVDAIAASGLDRPHPDYDASIIGRSLMERMR